MPAAVVSGREDSDQVSASKPLHAVHHALVSTDDLEHVVSLEELLYDVRPELHNVSCPLRVPHMVQLDSLLPVVVCGVRPQNVHYKLVLFGLHLVNNLKRALELFDLLHSLQS